ncbi:MAG: 16S rRNA (cytosine(1402)-N(4))-methyltransferase RsmH [Candidatus Pacebacteria bacterium]|nr:16S rRNA (cytosine(1402)-N(4))-methyltransferase RsmH [Candidatus Paceibacterota bacterium]
MHVPVLLNETIDGLNIHTGDVVFDGTVGDGGHSEAICKRYGRNVHLIMSDRDMNSLDTAKERLESLECKKMFYHGSFDEIKTILDKAGIKKIQRAMLDLGYSSTQLEFSGRGFSFGKQEPLLMNLDNPYNGGLTAKEIVNSWREEEIYELLKVYGEERFSGRIAKKIVEARRKKTIDTTADLVEIIESAIPFRKKINPATKTFQALRIAVNDELKKVEKAIDVIFESLSSGGRLAIISFHSLEDRIIKNKFKDLQKEGVGIVITKKPVAPTREEIKNNSRSRSAKLRIIEHA